MSAYEIYEVIKNFLNTIDDLTPEEYERIIQCVAEILEI